MTVGFGTIRIKTLGVATAVACVAFAGLVNASDAAVASGAEVKSAAELSAAGQDSEITNSTQGYYSLAYSQDLWYYPGSGSPYRVTYEQWRDAKFPVPRRAVTEYGQVPGDAMIWAQSRFGSGNDHLVVSELTFPDWAKAGYPRPNLSDPTPAFARGVLQWQGSNEVFYSASSQVGSWTRVSFSQWQGMGFPTPLYLLDRAIMKLHWSDVVSKLSSVRTGSGKTLTFAEWAALGAPTPTVVSGYPGQKFCTRGGPDIFYYGGGIAGLKMTFNQWVAAGGPRPTPC